MFWFYFIVFAASASVASAIGLIGGLIIMPEATHEQVYLFAGKVAVGVVLLICGIIYALLKTGHIKIEKNLIEEGQDEKQK